MDPLRASTLRWVSGATCAMIGMLILIAPHQLNGAAGTLLRPALPCWGAAFLLAGTALVAAAALRLDRRLDLGAHLAATAVLGALGVGTLVGGSFSSALTWLVLAVAVGLAALFPRHDAGARAPRGDLYGLAMGMCGAAIGVGTLAGAALDRGEATRAPALFVAGIALYSVATGIALVVAQLRPLPGVVRWTVHVLPAAGLGALALVVMIPGRLLIAIGVATVGAVVLALLPWLGPRLDRLDPTSLRTRLALVLVAAIALPLVGATAMMAERGEAAYAAEQRTRHLAALDALAHLVAHHLEVGHPDTAELAAQMELMASLEGASLYVVDERGELVASLESGRLGRSVADLLGAAASGEPTMARVETASGPHWVAITPVPGGGGWRVAVERPEASALAVSFVNRERTYGVLLLVVAGTWAIGALVAGAMTRPLGELSRAVESLATGDATAPLPRGGAGEVARLATLFGDMRDRLAVRTADGERARAALEAQAAMLREQARLLDLTNDAIVAREAQGRTITFWSAGAARAYGWGREEALGRDCDELLRTEYPRPAGEIRLDLLREGRWDGEVVHTARDGRRIPVASRWTLERDAAGRPVSILEIDTDVTERKETERRLIHAERLEAAGQAAAHVAHDLNNLLSPLVSLPGLIKMQLPAGHPAGVACDTLARTAERIYEINQDLLTLGRRGRVATEPLLLNEVVEDALASQSPIPATLALTRELAADLRPIAGSRAQLARVVTNLLINACEAMDDRGSLTVRTTNAVAGESDEVVLEVVDTGPGIEPALAERIFEPFFTTKRATERRGSGLGLGVVRAIVDDHGGCVAVESEPGRGARFVVRLPAVADWPVEASEPTPLAAASELEAAV